MNGLQTVITDINDVLWGAPMLILLFGTHLFLTFRTGFMQKNIFRAIRLSVKKDAGAEGDISQFGALTTALASTIGTGNIIGVGTAIALGGPGAVLWCWLTGVFGIATKYGESLIAVKYRVKTKDGRMLGGAMYALERGLHMKWLGILFALFAMIASFGIGSMVQTNAIASIWTENMNISGWVIGVVCALLTAVVILGGVKSIAGVCEKLVPMMAIFYVLGCILILCYNWDFIIPAIKTIVTLAFQPGAAAGGLAGSGMMMAARYGIARGLFSNESGMGSAPIVAAAAQTKNPVCQALVSSTGTFWDTVVVCAMTGLVLVSSILKNPSIEVSGITDGSELTTLAFGQIPYIGRTILVVGIVLFAYSTILGWAYYGERCAQYLGGRGIVIPYRILYILSIAVAPLITLNLVWDMADTFNALMAIPNLVALLFLSNVIVKETKKYINDIDKADESVVPVVDK
ncbi:sodium:alanine symporter family protein [Lachnospiraceae bacterium ZAX-1]